MDAVFKFNIGDKVTTRLYGTKSEDIEFTILNRMYGNADSGKIYKIDSNAPYDQWISENWFELAQQITHL